MFGEILRNRAAILNETGKDLLILEDLPLPELRVGQVLVRMSYSGDLRKSIDGARWEQRQRPIPPASIGP